MSRPERMRRVDEAMKKVISETIPTLKDPRIGFVTVTAVEVSPDLQHAWAYYTVFGDDSQQRGTAAGLRSAIPHLRHELGRQVRLKTVPELEFRVDESAARNRRIDEIIERIHREEGTTDG